MHRREFWALDGDDREVVDRLSPGLGAEAARVLAYLLLRSEVEDDPATALALRIGTGMNRTAVMAAVDDLEAAGVVERTTLPEEGPGRPPSAWHPTGDLERTARRVDGHRATELLEGAREHWGVAADPSPADSADLTLGLNWRPNGLHLPFYAGEEGGRYGPDGPTLAIDHYEGSHRALDAVLSEEADVGLVGAATVLRARAAGEPIVPIAIAYRRAMAVLYTVRETFGEPLSGVDQLRDRRVGMPARSETGTLGRLFLNQVALDGSVRIVDTGGEERDALLSGEVDVVTGSFSDPRDLERRGMTVDTLTIADRFPIYGPTLVVREETLVERGPALETFLAETTAGWAAACRDPTAAAERVAERSGEPAERIAGTFETASREFGGAREDGWGHQEGEPWDRLRAALEQGALLTDGAA